MVDRRIVSSPSPVICRRAVNMPALLTSNARRGCSAAMSAPSRRVPRSELSSHSRTSRLAPAASRAIHSTAARPRAPSRTPARHAGRHAPFPARSTARCRARLRLRPRPAELRCAFARTHYLARMADCPPACAIHPLAGRRSETAPMPSSNRMMTLVAFLQAQNCSNYAGSWRHPRRSHRFPDAGLLPAHRAATLEDGKFHLAFFDDRLAMPDIYGDDHRERSRNGIRAVKMDPITDPDRDGHGDQRLGLGVTYSTTYYEPFHVARTVRHARPDDRRPRRLERRHLAQRLARPPNFGRDEHLEHDAALRPRRRVHGGGARATGTPGRTTR